MRLNRKLSTVISLLLILMFCLPYSYAMADGPVPVITKNPTSEAIAIGGKTWFIAHADHATSMTWGLVDANGNMSAITDRSGKQGLLADQLMRPPTDFIINS